MIDQIAQALRRIGRGLDRTEPGPQGVTKALTDADVSEAVDTRR